MKDFADRGEMGLWEAGGEPIVARCSPAAEDADWDRFLGASPAGQFQQSSFWAKAKRHEGWESRRVSLFRGQRMVGGWQLLWRSMRVGRVGYISKGPVVNGAEPALERFAVGLIEPLARHLHLKAVIVQPADDGSSMERCLQESGYLPNRLVRVIDATAYADLSGKPKDLLARMNPTTRRNVRQAIKSGVTIREGTRDDVEIFFGLMSDICRRLGTNPNPARHTDLLALWDALHSQGRIRLSLARHQQKDVAGLLTILFGSTATLWKKGGVDEAGGAHSNTLIIQEAMQWAQAQGYARGDFVGFDRRMAESLLSSPGGPWPSGFEQSRYRFHYRLGGRPRLLPRAYVLIPSIVWRAPYRLFCRVARRSWA